MLMLVFMSRWEHLVAQKLCPDHLSFYWLHDDALHHSQQLIITTFSLETGYVGVYYDWNTVSTDFVIMFLIILDVVEKEMLETECKHSYIKFNYSECTSCVEFGHNDC